MEPGTEPDGDASPETRYHWVHVVAALAAMALVVGVLVLLGRSTGDDRVLPPPTTPTTLEPQPTPVPTSVAPAPTGTPTDVPTGVPTAPVPSITIPPLPTCLQPAAAAPLRVVSFNIHGGRTHTAYDIGPIVQEIRSWDADVVLLQEVHRFRRFSGFDDQPALLGTALGMTPVFGLTYTRAPEGPGRPRRESGNLILSRLPVLDSGNQGLPNQPGLEPRALLHVDVEVGDQRVRIYDTHLQFTAGDIRLLQTRAIRDLVRAAPAGPFLIGGDLNTTPDSQAVKVLSKIAVDPWPTVGTSEGLTVPARAPRRRIDYVLHGGGSWIARQGQTALSAVSDHRAVVLDYELPLLDPCA